MELISLFLYINLLQVFVYKVHFISALTGIGTKKLLQFTVFFFEGLQLLPHLGETCHLHQDAPGLLLVCLELAQEAVVEAPQALVHPLAPLLHGLAHLHTTGGD